LEKRAQVRQNSKRKIAMPIPERIETNFALLRTAIGRAIAQIKPNRRKKDEAREKDIK
jgi:hypothetical protein